MKNTIIKTNQHIAGLIVAASLSLPFTLASCSDKLDFFGNPNALRIEVEDEWTPSNETTRVSYTEGGTHTDFQAGDAIGVYAVKGSRIRANNVKFTMQEDGTWTGASDIEYDAAATYYAYFPYDANSTYTPTTSGTDVDTRFASFISDTRNVFWNADQSTKEKFDQSNLMIAEGTTTTAPRVKFTMEHKRGLAVIEPLNKWYYSTDADTKYRTSIVSFTNNIPYAEPSGNNLFLVKPSTSTTVGGKSVTISAGKYTVVDGIDASSGTPTFTYATSYDGGNTWTQYGVGTDEGASEWTRDAPAWLTVTPTSTDGGPTNFSCTVPFLPFPSADKRNAVLKEATAVSDYDLSMHDNDGSTRSSRTTANCYLVHAPGTYKLPLVYGNAIKNGAGNPSAYHTDQTGTDVMQNLVNHNDEAIYTGNATNDPWIKNHNITVDGAKLIWQDVKGLISSVGVAGDYLTFTVSDENIDEGNAVIAATANGTVVWSWHIWVTQETLAASRLTTVATGSHTYQVAPVNVGQHTKYERALCKVRAAYNDATIEFEVEGLYTGEYGTETSYQWGRKDPMMTSDRYLIDGSSFTPTSVESLKSYISIGTAIKNPDKSYCTRPRKGSTWVNSQYYEQDCCNYWDMNQTSEEGNISTATVKTVYDPCPPDFCTPTDNLYYYMGNNGNESSVIWESYGKHIGGVWKKDSPNLFFPKTDDITGPVGTYWSASSRTPNDFGSYGLYLNSSGWSYANGEVLFQHYSRIPVRPVKEE